MTAASAAGAGPRLPRLRLRIDLAYDGSPFAGFARQPDQTTVQGTLEGALSRCLGQEVLTTCAGRTDRGVHAVAQVVHLDVDPSVAVAQRSLADLLGGRPTSPELRRRVDGLVGPAITLWQVRRVPDDFDARFSATGRGYRYRLVDAETVAPLDRFDRWHVGVPLALPPMRAAARYLLGEHDFAAFCKRVPGRSSVRRLDQIAITRPAPGQVHVRLAGAAFCHNQVRSIVGCLVEVGRHRWEPDRVGEVLASRDRQLLARVAPPHGLTLERVTYGRRFPAAPPAGT
ncbi:tRNA pseudouridine(38-40) synthase TruA [Nitriliruptor alkaliphilus]|uniref:tRNA pseudouridine(38-40) synthase TruA n=1 Tax=Nitriliruptor alkaliphilus TaxID=427918 RepID=UPI000698E876|nr:tRNA pseudouridine(38-40) synthase TruA [Nitriliruptor alkaliphilus]